MRKKILGATFVITIMTVAGFNVYMNQAKSDLSEMALANIEALANPEYDIDGGELGEVEIVCGEKYGPCWVEYGFCFEGEYTHKDCGFIGYPTFSCRTKC